MSSTILAARGYSMCAPFSSHHSLFSCFASHQIIHDAYRVILWIGERLEIVCEKIIVIRWSPKIDAKWSKARAVFLVAISMLSAGHRVAMLGINWGRGIQLLCDRYVLRVMIKLKKNIVDLGSKPQWNKTMSLWKWVTISAVPATDEKRRSL